MGSQSRLCRNGLHNLDNPANVYVRPSTGRRQCKPCMRAAHGRRNAERRRSDPTFRERENARSRAWGTENREYRDEYERRWRAENPDRRRAAVRADYRRHRARRLAKNKAWREANPDRMRELVRAWRQANPDRLARAERMRRARRHGAASDGHSRQDVLDRWGTSCWMCGEDLDSRPWHEDHVVPLTGGGADTIDNCKPSCPPCNLKKGSRLLKAVI